MDIQMPGVGFTNLPTLGVLQYVIVAIDPKEPHESSVKSDFQWQLLKTRLLIYSCNQVIACPYPYQTKYINVICKKEFWETGHLLSLLNGHHLMITGIGDINMRIYHDCLVYHIVCRISPRWNKIENYFIWDKFFLLAKNPLNAIRVHLHISGDELILYCEPKRLWLTPLTLDDFFYEEILPSVEENVQYTIRLPHPVLVHVLPSFKRGHAVSVSNHLPSNCSFASYDEIQRHWKNTYGFRLPKSCTGMIYVEVKFYGPQSYTYPLPCLRKGMHENVGDPHLIVDFADHVFTNASTVCGQELHLASIENVESSPSSESHGWYEKNLNELQKRLVYENRPEIFNQALESRSRIDNKILSPSEDPSVTWFRSCSNFIAELESDESIRNRSHQKVKPVNIQRKSYEIVTRKPIIIENPYKVPTQQKESPSVTPSISESSSSGCGDISSVTPPSTITNVTPYKPVFTTRNKPAILKINSGMEYNTNSGKSVEKLLEMKSYLKQSSMRKQKEAPSVPSFAHKKCQGLKDPFKENTKQTVQPWKPAPYSDQDILEHARYGRLNKVNVPALISFLKKYGIQCRSKEAKSELVKKTKHLLHEKGVIV